jgi:predicted nucleic acid-binding protein
MSVPRASVDTCFFLRYLTGEPPEQAEKAERTLRKAESGKLQLVVPSLVIAEIIWTLETSIFQLSKRAAAEKAIAILNMPGIEVDNARLLEEAAALHAELNIDSPMRTLPASPNENLSPGSTHSTKKTSPESPDFTSYPNRGSYTTLLFLWNRSFHRRGRGARKEGNREREREKGRLGDAESENQYSLAISAT